MTAKILGAAAAEIYELVPDGIVVVMDNGLIAHASSRAEAMLGYGPAELVGRAFESVIPKALHEDHVRHRAQSVDDSVARPMGSGLQLRALRKDGTELPVDVSLASRQSSEGLVVVAGIVDRTASRRTALELRLNRERLQSLIRSVPDTAIFSVDEVGTIHDWNPSASSVTGLTTDDAVGMNFARLYPAVSRNTGEPEELLSSAAKDRLGSKRGWLLRPDGSRYFAETTITELSEALGPWGRIFAVVIRDVTEPVLLAARLASAAAFNEALTSDGGVGRLYELLRELIDGVLSPGSVEFVLPGEQPKERPQQGGAITQFQIRTDHETLGTVHVSHTSETPTFTPDEIRFIKDISESLVDALARRRANKDRERLSILEDQERIARDLHDSVIQHIFAAGLQLQATAQRIGEETARAEVNTVIDNLDACIAALRSAIYRLEGHTDEHEIRQKVLNLVAATAPTLGFMPSVRFEGPVDIVLAGTTAEDTLMTLSELLSNTAQHAHATGADVVLQIGDSLVLTVSDNGIGIPTDRERGNGLGNADERAQTHHGSFSWTTPPGGGTISTWRALRF